VSSKQSIFFSSNRSKPKLNLFRSFIGLFREINKNFLLCFGVSDRYGNNRNKQNFFETNRKNLHKKCSLLECPRNNFFQFESKHTETQSVPIVFQDFFRETPQNFFGLFQCFGPVLKQPKQTELMVWGIKKVYILTNLLLFW
jgi:hypothetical protein